MKMKRSKLYQHLKRATLATSLALPSALALGQEESEDLDLLFEELVVTARKIQENAQEIPMSITAFSANAMKDKGIENLTDIARSTAGFAFEDFNGGFGQPTIRGQSSSSLINPVQNVATFYNGIYLPRQYMIDSTLLNVDQVEVLKGPQSAALGRNAFAGAITYNTKRPTDDPEFNMTVAAGTDDYEKVQVEVSSPIVPDVLGFVAGIASEEWDGAWENNHALADASNARTKGNLDGFDSTAVMFGLEFTPLDNLTISANYLDSEKDIESPPQYSIGEGSFLASYFPINELNCGATAGNGLTLFCGELPLAPPLAGSDGDARPAGLVVDPRSGITVEIFMMVNK